VVKFAVKIEGKWWKSRASYKRWKRHIKPHYLDYLRRINRKMSHKMKVKGGINE